MSASPVSSPIQRLNFDVLWHIFDINADICDDDRALETTLATSYVCHDWRSLLLNSTSIWPGAHVMYLDHYMVEGFQEIIRRSGTALLWIKADSLYCYWSDMKHIPKFIDEHWDRIQKLEMTIHDSFVDRWTSLRRPAPHLESLRITFNCDSSKISDLVQSLFSGSAALLRDLRWKGYGLSMSGLKIMQLPWLHQVRCMELSAGMTVSTTLRVLESTMNLANLRLDYVVENYCATTLPIVSLPKLVHLDLNLFKTLTPGAVLLEHMVIPASCAMALSARQIQREEIDKENTFGPIIAAISAYAQRCLAHHLPQ